MPTNKDKVPLDSLYFMHSSSVGKVCGIDNCRVTRCGYTVEDGVEISVPVKEAELLVGCLMASTNAKPKLAGLGAWDVLRIEAGLCLQGSDITDEDTTPVEAGIDFVIGKRRRKTMGLTAIKSGLALRSHMPIVDPTNKSAVGFVTSGCLSPTLGRQTHCNGLC